MTMEMIRKIQGALGTFGRGELKLIQRTEGVFSNNNV